MNQNCFVSIDFDGTIVDSDITDAVIQKFARPGWEIAERMWEDGEIGSRECLTTQMALVGQPLQTILLYIDQFTIDSAFPSFLSDLNTAGIPHAIISDGFRVFIERLLRNAGIDQLPPVYANDLIETSSGLKAVFPNVSMHCNSGTCKCTVAHQNAGERAVVLVGDGRSDFCLARHADHVFAKGKLPLYCEENGLTAHAFQDFRELAVLFRQVSLDVPVPGATSRFSEAMKERDNICNQAQH